jgi:hypothetical protein
MAANGLEIASLYAAFADFRDSETTLALCWMKGASLFKHTCHAYVEGLQAYTSVQHPVASLRDEYHALSAKLRASFLGKDESLS